MIFKLFRKKKVLVDVTLADKEVKTIGDGWTPWLYKAPTEYRFEIYRVEWDKPRIVDYSGIHPAMDANGLYWREPMPEQMIRVLEMVNISYN